MNLSGKAMTSFKKKNPLIDIENLLIVHDDL